MFEGSERRTDGASKRAVGLWQSSHDSSSVAVARGPRPREPYNATINRHSPTYIQQQSQFSPAMAEVSPARVEPSSYCALMSAFRTSTRSRSSASSRSRASFKTSARDPAASPRSSEAAPRPPGGGSARRTSTTTTMTTMKTLSSRSECAGLAGQRVDVASPLRPSDERVSNAIARLIHFTPFTLQRGRAASSAYPIGHVHG